ncbi:MAG: ABC transporter ATP-binding protein [Acidiferrobacterales bacterium]
MSTVVRIENLSKRYVIGHRNKERYSSLRDVITSQVQGTTRKFLSGLTGKKIKPVGLSREEFWALKDINLEIQQGDRIGIIGRNGAGKSTLLKVLSRITEPTEGKISIRGRVASLLEVGTGFHPELSGRENIFLNGAILGMSKSEIKSRFDEIVEFAEIERFLDTPVKRYSSGMYVRLAFSVAAHLEPEILIIDEVLAVGDAAFQKKCLGRMEEVGNEGRTVLFVSHNMAMLNTLCDRALVLEEGTIGFSGLTTEAIRHYLVPGRSLEKSSEISWDESVAPGGEELKLTKIGVLGPEGTPQEEYFAGSEITIEIRYTLHKPVSNMRVVLQLKTDEQIVAFSSTDERSRLEPDLKPGAYSSSCTIPANLLNSGKYHVFVHCGIPGKKVLCEGQDYLIFNVVGGQVGGSYRKEKWPGVVAPKLNWKVHKEGI